ncbi:B12-binding domain-containing radical SAM protein [Sphingobium sufflavum]|uniref:B12-binding domain-containing radical SAM protein n=1 Tax=Sphingobium sufflavum TaxID=1129547 RepID=UPI001F4473FB|nr:radical SAM protein [Sphingobium sufflavum]MCE7798307.1 B12-binding domain-containing radical SAM protein [Sphingobium sufflavum]
MLVSENEIYCLSANRGHRTLLVDLNNFASFPTLAVGILVAALRNAGHRVDLMVPLAYDVPASAREKPDRLHHHMMRKVHLSTAPGTRILRDRLRSLYYARQRRPHATVIREVTRALDQKPDILLLSAYLQHHETVVELCRLAKLRNIPVLLGGPAFNLKGTVEAWRSMPGLTAIYGGEADLSVPDLVSAIVERKDLRDIPGVVLPDGSGNSYAPPLRELDKSPVPDFTDFPWDRYPVRIIPIMTGRGCQWARCLFCSDVVSANGRTFRTRSLEIVLHEMREQSHRYGTSNFLFLDLKLNSNPHLLRGLVENVQMVVPGAQWIGTVHVDLRKDNGLTRSELRAAASAGMRRVSFGLESGSQRMLDLMDKGASAEANETFINHASEAGISVRCTMFKGFPGEQADDLERTADFLVRNSRHIDRIRFNDFSILEDTPIWNSIMSGGNGYPDIRMLGTDAAHARLRYAQSSGKGAAYRKAMSRVLSAVYAINRRPLRDEARMFDGLM